MNSRTITLLVVSLVLGILKLVVVPLREGHNETFQKIQLLEKKLSSSINLEGEMPVLKQELANLDLVFSDFKKSFKPLKQSTSKQQNVEQQLVQKFLKDNKVKVTSLRWREADEDELTSSLIMELVATGKLTDIQRAIHSLESSNMYIFLKELRIMQVYRKAGEANLNCQIHFNFLNEQVSK
ncbi:MAG: GspMb/PilO family protein [Lentisphaeraceae bacterium]|nr:GspMb/PilO family protein [Lentisphaeraceae bacterium]